MTHITVTDEEKAALLAKGERFEVRDRAGRVILRARADVPPDPPPSAEWPAEWTREELDRRRREGQRFTPEAGLEYIRRKLGCS